MSGAVPLEQLLRWLDSDPDRLERHLARHPADEARLELSTALDDGALGLLGRALTPSANVIDEIRRRLTPDPAITEAAGIAADLLALSWRTAALLFGPDVPVGHDLRPSTRNAPVDTSEAAEASDGGDDGAAGGAQE